MLSIAQQYTAEFGDNAIARFVFDLERDDPANFKSGYTRPNAVIAAAEAFDVSRDEVCKRIMEAEQS